MSYTLAEEIDITVGTNVLTKGKQEYLKHTRMNTSSIWTMSVINTAGWQEQQPEPTEPAAQIEE